MSVTDGCGNCEFRGQSVSAFAGETKLALLENGGIVYMADNSHCGASFGKVNASELETCYPEFLQRLAECDGPIEEAGEVPRMWPLGLFGLTKEAAIRRCGATDREEMMEIISESQERIGIHKLKLEEAHGN